MTDCHELGKHSVEITPKWFVGKELDWMRLNERKIEITKNNTYVLCNIEWVYFF